MPATNIFISGYYGFDNAGDEAILSVLLRQLRSEFGEISASVLSGNPGHTRAWHGVDAVLWSDPLAMAERVRAADLVIIGGGGLFHDYSGFLPDSLLTAGNFGLGFHVTAAVLASLFRRPLMLYAVGVGPLLSEHGRRFTRAACEAASAITVRDSGSRDLLLSLGIPSERITVTADPAFALQPASPERAREILAAAGAGSAKPLLGVSVRHWAIGVHPAFWEKEVATALDLFLEQAGGSVLFIPFQQIEGVQENDVAVAASVRSQMRLGASATILHGQHRPEEIAAVLGACDVVLGMRLHALIFSAVAGVPCVGLRYDPKVEQIARQLGASTRLLDLGAVSATAISDLLRQAYANGAHAPATDLASRAAINATIAARLPGTPAPAPSPLLTELQQTGVLALLGAQKRLLESEASLRRQIAASEQLAASFEQECASYEARGARTDLEHQSILAEISRDHERRLREVRAEHEVRLREVLAAHESETRESSAELAWRDRQLTALSQAFLTRKERLAALHERLALVEARAVKFGVPLEAGGLDPAAAGTSLDAHVHQEIRKELARNQRLLAQWRNFADEYRRILAEQRRQRAWTVMLSVRKAYSMLCREGLRGKLLSLWVLGTIFGRPRGLSEQEPPFPEPPSLPGDGPSE